MSGLPARRPSPLQRLAPALAIGLLTGPVSIGLILVLLPAFGWLPALGGDHLGLDPWMRLWEVPGLGRSVMLSLTAGLVSGLASLAITLLFLAAFTGSRWLGGLRRLVSPLLSVPHAAAAFGLAFLVAPSGLLFRTIAPWLTESDRPPDIVVVNDPMGLTLTLGLVIKEVPFLLLMSLAALPQPSGQARPPRLAFSPPPSRCSPR